MQLVLRLMAVVLLLAYGQAVAAAGAASSGEAAGEPLPKFALVIGNGNYSGNKRSLKNPVNDARLMTQSLRKLGFEVKQHTDLDRAQMVRAVADFSAALPQGATALMFYAGHGMQIGGASYLIPVDMAVTSEQSVPLRTYPAKTMLEQVSASRSSVNVVVLDACRDNPFQPSSPVKYRNFSNLGLAPVQAPRGTVVAYSTAPGQLAADGKDGNSIYTATLASVILEPRMSLEGIFKKVGDQVRKKTLDDQIPWFESSLTEEYFFQPPDGVTVVAGRPLQVADPSRSDKALKRGAEKQPPDFADKPWYRSMTDYEWSNLDWEIQQRVKQMKADQLPEMEHKAKGGNVVAQMTLGMYWLESSGMETYSVFSPTKRHQGNNATALKWLHMAANAGFPIAQAELGERYYLGKAVDRNVNESRRLLELAALANYPRAKLDILDLNSRTGTADGRDLGTALGSMLRSMNAPVGANR